MKIARGQVALITGASEGLGLACAHALAERGVRLVLCARRGDRLQHAIDELRAAGAAAEDLASVAIDVTAHDAPEQLVQTALDRFGRLDMLWNNAGRGYYARAEQIDAAALADLFALNVIAPLRLTQAALPALRRARGAVVMISSLAGVATAPGMGAYNASKFALEALSSALRAELHRDGVQVLVVRPGPVATQFRDHADAAGEERLSTPSGRDTRQRAEAVAAGSLAALQRGQAVYESSWYVRSVSLLSRALPPLFRRVSAHMAKRR